MSCGCNNPEPERREIGPVRQTRTVPVAEDEEKKKEEKEEEPVIKFM